MLTYSVTVGIDAEVEPEWVSWMGRIHIPEVLATRRFGGFRFRKMLEPRPESGRAVYVIEYEISSMAQLKAYQELEAPRLQAEHAERFAGRFEASRAVLDDIQVY